ncbi:hypothetical protein GCM10027403_08050 [Arthrobacter tecti]
MDEIVSYVRFQSAHANAHGRYAGIFGLANGLAREGQLSAADHAWWRTSNDWCNAAYPDPSTVDASIYDRAVNPAAQAWFKGSAAPLLAKVDEYMELLQRYGVECVRVTSKDPGRVLYEDDFQIVVDPHGVERIALVAPNREGWANRYNTIEQRLKALLPHAAIEHIGSTAVPDLPAKDVVDVLVGVDADAWAEAVAILVADGFPQDGSREGHAWLALMRDGERTAVIHVVVLGGAEWKRRISFRDILRRDRAARAEYLEVKRQAAVTAENWTDYTGRKAAIVARILR